MSSSPATSHSGGCRCGAIQFLVSGEPRFVANCHCLDCRRSTGAPFSTWVGWRNEQVAWSGAQRGIYVSSHGVERGFCTTCGTPLSYQGAKWPGETHIPVGVFDLADDFRPEGDVFKAEALEWALLPDAR